ncbi:DUF1553 domain-containing protein [Verrucomicrobiales bacterium]|nr:DUF1553 domain-containing protein [Verrucomicrobiales bacterium]
MKCFIFIATLYLSIVPHLSATPANHKAFEKYFGPLLSENQKSCAVCHVRDKPEGAESLKDFPHNPFGKSLAALDGKIVDRFDTVFSSGDALDKILVGIKPAEPGQVTDLTLLSQKKEQFDAFHNRYPWRPFEQVKRPDVPTDTNNWGSNEIDHFIAAEHVRLGLSPRSEASPEIWLRRVTVDLTGLVPSTEEIRAFQKNPDYEAKVDELLASPHYGERWGRHFMDVWRYADWSGYKGVVRQSARHIWNWRDWIVESLNDDKGYDQMILEMFAADELYPGDEKKLRATGYLARNFQSDRNQAMDEVVTHTSQAFLGVTMGCSKCHDHMYDPFPQTDYYAMRAFFDPYRVRTDRVPGELDVMKNGIPRAYDVTLTAKTYLYARGDERFPVKDQAIPPGIPAALGGDLKIEEVPLPVEVAEPWRRDFVKSDLLAERDADLKKATDALAELTDESRREVIALQVAAMEAKKASLVAEFAVEALEKTDKSWKAKAEATFEAQRKVQEAEAKWKTAESNHAKQKADADLAAAKAKKDGKAIAAATTAGTAAKKAQSAAKKLTDASEKKNKEALSVKYTARDKEYIKASSGRRTAFARWLADKKNPLTARVAANHIWLRHFETGLVPTVNDFGANGREPTHPALLDWLAAELMQSDWSFKELHKTIVLSATYRMESTPDSASHAVDPDNRFLWRMPTRRMEGEIVRDNLLWVSGRLDPTMGGPDIPNDEAQTSVRRSIYLTHAHERLVEFVQIFDGPKVSECYSREESIQPHQALAMHNSPLTQKAAEKLSFELKTEDPDALVADIFLQLLGRAPSEDEKKLCLDFLTDGGDDPLHIRERLIAVLLNHHEFVTIR